MAAATFGLVSGGLLGGPVGLGTIVYAVSIGPLVQFFLPRLTVDLEPAAHGVTVGHEPAPTTPTAALGPTTS